MKIQERYRSKTPRQALAHVIEECGEVLAAAGKTLRFGPWSTNPEIPAAKPEANFRWLMREMADLEAAMEVFKEICGDDGEQWDE